MRFFGGFHKFILGAVLFGMLPVYGFAGAISSPIPPRRIVLFENTDLYGGDLENIFDVTLDQCETACLANAQCKAFTYNTKASACFPKSVIGEKSAFDGALSAEVVEVGDKLIKQGQARAKTLAFLPDWVLQDAARVAKRNGNWYPTNGWSGADLLDLARKQEAKGDLRRAVQLTFASLNDGDRASGWIEIARLANRWKTKDSKQRKFINEIAVAGGVNGYLRAAKPATQANALLELATALENRRFGRRSIPVLRLAYELSARKDIEQAIDRAVSLFGFRITDHSVDQNNRQPRVCATFSEPLAKAGIDYGDFVKTAETGLAIEPQGSQLCIEGVTHGQTLRATFRKGLPGASGEVLHKSVELEVYIPDRDPVARFEGRSYILPRHAGASLPLTTVNLDRVNLAIYRIGDRNLLRAMQEGLLSEPLSSWDLAGLKRNLGDKIWTGSADIKRELNREVITALPVGQAIETFAPGIYAMTAQDPNNTDEQGIATQWFVVTDLGISTMQGNDGLHVFARSLGQALPVGGAKVQLLARNNDVLGEATTDEAGYAHFAAGLVRGTAGNAPAMVTLRTQDDFAFIDQGAAEFDLSDRGVEGLPSPPPIDVFLATDRGAYRPGETVHATLLARDNNTIALRDLPLTLELRRPDGVMYAKRLVQDQGAGGGVASFSLSDNARRGTWKLRVYGDQKAKPLLEQRLLVEDFVPERIDFDLAMQTPAVHLGDSPVVSIDAKYLYGAAGANLPVEGEVTLGTVKSVKGYSGYSFGRADERFDTRYASIEQGWQTGADGHLTLPVKLPAVGKDEVISKPLQIETYIRLREGSGRPVERRIKAPVQPAGPLIGIRPLFEDQAQEDSNAEFEVLAIGPDLQRVDLPRVVWELNRVDTRFQWFESYGNWDYEPVTTRKKVASGKVALQAADLARIAAPVDYGEYELKLTSLDETHASASYTFYAGWYVSAAANATPDRLSVALDRPVYAVGEHAQLRIESRFDGVAQISVLSDRLIETRTVPIQKGANSVDMVVGPKWGAGAYVTASAFRPMDVAAGRNPSRALGLVYAKVDPAEKLLKARFVNEDEANPRKTMTARLVVDGAVAGQPVYATVAAVDVGVLNITGFETPSPDDHYFGQRKLGMGLRDVYGRLIDGLQGNMGALRSGGDGGARNRLGNPPPTEKVLAEFSGLVQADAKGEIAVDFDLPDFNGTVRLMAVVWSDKSVGHAQQDVLVRDPVVITANAPRFLSPGDQTQLVVELAHAFGPTGDFQVGVTVGSGLQAQAVNQVVALGDKQRKSLIIPITATATGGQAINIWVKTPDDKALNKSLTLPVLHNDPEVARQTRLQLAAGENWLLDENMATGLFADSVRATLSVGPLARLDAPGLLTALNRYPYGCTEQITSKALPLLYFKQLSAALDLADPQLIDKRVSQAITGVLSNQASNGAFGLWRPGSNDLWLDAYVSDFLSRARAEGFAVPEPAFARALDNLRNKVNYAADFESGGEDLAYALMVLAREGQAAIGDLRYYADTRATAFATPLAQAQLGAALTSYGDQMRADRMFRLSSRSILKPEKTRGWRVDYGSHLRDAAAMLTLAVDAGTQAMDQEALLRSITLAPVQRRSTQENVWTLLAANSLSQDQVLDGVVLNGSPMRGPMVRSFDGTGLAQAQSLLNNSARPLTAVATVYGVPSEPEPAGGHGYTIERHYYTMDGAEVDPAQVALNTRLVVELTVLPHRSSEARLMVNDPLPAGFEIDNPHLLSGASLAQLDWLDALDEVENTEFRTDRFLVAVDWSGKQAFSLAYVVRAVSPGRFHHPAASVEDMYRPEFRARTAAGTLEVVSR